MSMRSVSGFARFCFASMEASGFIGEIGDMGMPETGKRLMSKKNRDMDQLTIGR